MQILSTNPLLSSEHVCKFHDGSDQRQDGSDQKQSGEKKLSRLLNMAKTSTV